MPCAADVTHPGRAAQRPQAAQRQGLVVRGRHSPTRTTHCAALLCAALAVRAAGAAFICAPSDNPVQCASLGALFAATDGPGWGNNTGWSAAAAGTPTSYCQFYGVTCMGGAMVTVCVCSGACASARLSLTHKAVLRGADPSPATS